MTQSFLQLLEPLKEPEPVIVDDIPSIPAAEIAAEILDKARVDADRILNSARRDVEIMLRDAKIQAEFMRETARIEGYRDGEATARAEVEERLRTEMETYRTDIHAELQGIVDSIAEDRSRLWEQQEKEMLGFVLDISKQVIKTEVAQNEQVLMEILRNAMRRVTDKENMRIRVSVSDAARIKSAREEVMQIVDGIRSLEIVDDRRIGVGGCVIETNAGNIDAKIETQLGEIERTILETNN